MDKDNINQYIPIMNSCLVILTGVALTAFLSYTKAVVLPLVVAMFISMLSNTLATWMKERWGVPRVLGLIITVVLFLGFAALSVLFVSSSIESFISGADAYAKKLNETLDWILASAQSFGFKTNPEFINDYINKIPIFNMVRGLGGGIVSFFTSTSLVCLFVIFMFLGNASEKTDFAGTIQKQISFYLLIKILVSLIAAVLTWIVLVSVRCELAFMLAFLTFLLNFIPNIGPLISTVMPMPVIFLRFGFDWHIILALSLLGAIHFTVGNILETKWLGKQMELSPVVVIVSLVFWALVWGVMGALLAVPLTSVLKMVLERSEPTKPLAMLLEGKLPFK